MINKIDFSKVEPKFPIKLEIGCGDKKHWRQGYDIRMDIADFGQEIVWDLEKGIPLADNLCDEIYASHVLEHVHKDSLIHILNECWRVLTQKGKLWVIVPAVTHEAAYIASHLIQFNEGAFKFFTGALNEDYEPNTLHRAINERIKLWDTESLVTNNKQHIHWIAHPKGKNL